MRKNVEMWHRQGVVRFGWIKPWEGNEIGRLHPIFAPNVVELEARDVLAMDSDRCILHSAETRTPTPGCLYYTGIRTSGFNVNYCAFMWSIL